MLDPAFVNVLDIASLLLFSGRTKRCKCDGVTVSFNFDNGQRVASYVTDLDGLLTDTGISCDVQYSTVKITTSSQYWKNVTVTCKITWDETGSGKLGLESINLEVR